MRRDYRYTVTGTDADGRHWVAKGNLKCEFRESFELAIEATKADLGSAAAGSGKIRLVIITRVGTNEIPADD